MRGALTPRRICRAGLGIIDKDGPKALTMRRVAAALGVEAMSLYYHVPNKDALVEGVLDLLFAEAKLPSGEVDAVAWIEGTAAAFRRLASQHPRAFPLLLTRPVPMIDPEAAGPMEAGLAAFVALGRTVEEAFSAVQLIALSMLSLGLLESTSILGGPVAESHVDALPDTFPLLNAIRNSPVEIDGYWQLLVQTLVRGMTSEGTGPS